MLANLPKARRDRELPAREVSPVEMRSTIAALFALLVAACGAHEKPPPPRLVVLYASCTVNKDYLAPYSKVPRHTPSFEAFAKEALVFRRHVCESGQSGIDFATLLTGTQADKHGVYFHPTKLDDRNQMIAESFAAAGYDTWFFSGHPMASAALNYGQGVAPDQAIEHAMPFRNVPKSFKAPVLENLAANTEDFERILARLRA